MQNNDDYLDIDESKPEFSIEKLVAGSEAMIKVFHKHLQKYVTRAKFWKPRLEIGKKCMDAMRREVFTPGMRVQYRSVEGKWPIELQLMKKTINTLSDQIEKAVPGSTIEYEDETPPEYAAKPEVAQTTLTWMKTQLSIKERRKRALRDGLVTGYPICLWFEKVRGVASVPGLIPLIPSVPAWESVLPDPYFTEDTGIRDVTFVKAMGTLELYNTFPDRVDEHKAHLALLQSPTDKEYMNRLLLTDTTVTADDRSEFLYKMIGEASFNSSGGRYFLIQNVYPISKKMRYWIDEETLDVFIPPPDWTPFQKDMWLKTHPEFTVSGERDFPVLWVTIIDSSGFVWENKLHWYQEDGQLPGEFYIADMIDNVPHGAGEDRLPYVLLASACATEGLDQVRKGTGRLTVIAEGSIRQPNRLRNELTASEGVAIAKKNVNPKDAIAQFKREPNTTFMDMQDRVERALDEIDSPNAAMTGASNPRQSEKAKRMELQQGLSPHAPYVDHYMKFELGIENLLCKFIPRVLTEEMVIQIRDEYGKPKEPVVINGTEIDTYSGEAKRIVNDIVSPRYRAVASVADESITSRESQMKDFMELLEATGNQLFQLDPTLMGRIIGVFPNMFAREASKFLIEFGSKQQDQQAAIAQAEMAQEDKKQKQRKEIELEKLRRPKVAVKLDAESIKNAPDGAKILYQLMKAYEASAPVDDEEVPAPAPGGPEELPPEAEQPGQVSAEGMTA